MIYFLALLILVVAPVLIITEVARVAINGDKKRK
jgi:hypothetical protein